MSAFFRTNGISASTARLRAPAPFTSALRRAVRALRALPPEDRPPFGIPIEDNARFLAEEAENLKRRLHGAPLPAENGTPRVLLLARKLLRDEQNTWTPGRILRAVSAFYGENEPEHRELCSLADALTAAALENLLPVLAACAGESPAPDQAESMRLEKAALRSLRVLRLIRQIPFDALIERASPLCRILRQDGTYRRMDEKSRNYYIFRVLFLSNRLHVAAPAVARAALHLAEGKEGIAGESGYYLTEKPELIARYLMKRKNAPFFRRHESSLPWLIVLLSAAIFGACAFLIGVPLWALPVWLLCGGEITRLLIRPLLRRAFPARMLPRIRPQCLPGGLNLLIAVPALLLSPRQVFRLARHLAVLKEASPHADILLLGDLPDSDTAECPEDGETVRAAAAAIEALNGQQGDGFILLLRGRSFDAGQEKYTGWERKRGALLALNRLLTGQTGAEAFSFCSCDPAALQDRYAYVITLDADTFLPAGAAERLMGSMEHPLQKGRLSVIQPVMETAPDRVETRVQRWLGGRGGADAYHLSRQEAYQDVFGRGSFVGKGIYAPGRWLGMLEGKLPEGRILSHDLIEGELSGCALADDILLFDGHPKALAGWQKRLHRWTRGDWQLLPFLFSRYLDGLSKYKIYDNLRRSLLPIAQVLLLLLGTALGKPLLLLLALPWPLRGMPKRLLLLPGKAYTLSDAILRALYRQRISHKNLLSWVTAEQAEGGHTLPFSCVSVQLLCGALMTALALMPGGFLPAVWLGLYWASGVLLIPYLDGKDTQERPLNKRQTQEIRSLARDTWRFFAENVTEKTLYLPPDNVQLDPMKGAAMRTSPTNIGLYLLSCAAARKMNLITTSEMARRMDSTLSTVERLRRWHGHLYNWYDLTNGAPLPPKFVSTVDSGNLSACLMACAQVCRSMLDEMEPVFHSLPMRMDGLSRQMDFSRLYDRKAGLFSVGCDTEQRRLSGAHYDHLAGEARLTSFVAIRQKQVPRKHWQRLNRACVRAGGGTALLSWGGTAFEYLLPALLLPLIPGTLTGEGCKNAIRAQMAAAGSRPFGISESGYYAFDAELHYQYRAFGLPALAVSTETAGQVVAPYASMLALPFFPAAAARNLERMKRLGWADAHGLYEAVDFSPQRMSASPQIIKSHMAHHQGMILCAVCNALTDFSLVKAFMTPPDAEAAADLLWERAERPPRKRKTLPAPRAEATAPGFPERRANAGFPLDAQALFGHGMSWVITGQGSGFLSARGVLLSRFREETDVPSGPQLYLKNAQTGETVNLTQSAPAFFAPGRVRYEGVMGSVRYELHCFVTPLEGMAVHLLTLENTDREPMLMEAASFIELAQGGKKADQAHPNYRDLSVRVQPWGENGLVSTRLPRDERDATPCVYHAVTGAAVALRRQGDRRLFLGRDGSYANPAQMLMPFSEAYCRTGDVLAPCLSLRAQSRVQGKSVLCFVTFADAPGKQFRGGALSPERLAAKLPLAITQYQMTLKTLHIDHESLPVCQQILGALLCSRQPHQLTTPLSARNALWGNGISGDLPVLLVDLKKNDRTLIQNVLKAHGWMRAQGIWADVIFLCAPEREYLSPIRDTLSHLMRRFPSLGDPGQAGGVHIVPDEGEKKEALLGAARLTLFSGTPLKEQLAALQTEKTAVPALTPPLAIQPPELSAFNGIGGFADSAYWIAAPAPVPWHHLLSGRRFGTLVCEQGILQSFGKNSFLDQLTRPAPDVHRHWESEELFLRTEDGHTYPLIRCTAAFSPGMAEYHTLCGDICSDVSVFSDPEQPFGLRQIVLRSEKEQRIRLLYRPRFALGEAAEFTRVEKAIPFLFARSGEWQGVVWAALTGDGIVFPHMRESADAETLLCETMLRPHTACAITAALGIAKNPEEASATLREINARGAGTLEREVRAFWQQRLSGLCVYGVSKTEKFLFNGFVPYQVWTARLMSRMGPYQHGGAYGFRDQLQDLLALLHTAPAEARAHILRCAAHQFPEGDVQHWWHAPRTGVRTRVSDDKLFLPFLTALYVTVTGDTEILRQEIPYLSSPVLAENEQERYETPAVAPLSETLTAHCLRAVRSVRLGAHGLPLMGSGDWNDGMNRMGGAKGESVWLGFFLALVLRLFAPLCDSSIAEELAQTRRRLIGSAESAWTGKWYLRAFRDSGAPVGGPDTVPPRIDLICQCFAVLAGAPRSNAREALRNAVERLYDRENGIVLLTDVPYSPEENAGYIGAYLPGVRENGGQYTHAAPWLVLALCELGENDLAWEITDAILPLRHADTPEKVSVYQLEPYVFCGDVSAGQNIGRGGWSWYTGSAAWMYYVYFTCLLGFEKRGDRARLRPHPRREQEEYTVAYRFGHTLYHFTAAANVLFPTLDGEKLQDGWASLRDDGHTHEARYPLQ